MENNECAIIYMYVLHEMKPKNNGSRVDLMFMSMCDKKLRYNQCNCLVCVLGVFEIVLRHKTGGVTMYDVHVSSGYCCLFCMQSTHTCVVDSIGRYNKQTHKCIISHVG